VLFEVIISIWYSSLNSQWRWKCENFCANNVKEVEKVMAKDADLSSFLLWKVFRGSPQKTCILQKAENKISVQFSLGKIDSATHWRQRGRRLWLVSHKRQYICRHLRRRLSQWQVDGFFPRTAYRTCHHDEVAFLLSSIPLWVRPLTVCTRTLQ